MRERAEAAGGQSEDSSPDGRGRPRARGAAEQRRWPRPAHAVARGLVLCRQVLKLHGEALGVELLDEAVHPGCVVVPPPSVRVGAELEREGGCVLLFC